MEAIEKIKDIPNGTRDIIGTECKMIESVIKDVNETLESYGYESVITPTLEYEDTFDRISSEFETKHVYKIFDSEGKTMSLKCDSTLPIARLVSSKLKDQSLPLRLKYSSKIFRKNKALGGKRNELHDIGIELIGEEEFIGDIEAINIGIELLKNLKVENFKFEIGHIKIIKRILDKIEIDDTLKNKLVKLLINKELVELEFFIESLNITNIEKKLLVKLPWLFGDKLFLEKNKYLFQDEEIICCIDYLLKIYKVFETLGLSEFITFDLGAIEKIDYYSGIIFNVYIDGACSSVIQGGRYDNLMSLYGRDISGIGFSIKVDDLTNIVDSNLFDNEVVKYILFNDSNYLENLKIANLLRKNKTKVILKRE
ncbi:MAG: ATP phosphoribosyltransferase regulatory subunit [Sarcina sp.]